MRWFAGRPWIVVRGRMSWPQTTRQGPELWRLARSRAGRSAQWRGAGGRWMVWAFRAVVWAVLLIVGYRGVTGIVAGPPRTGSAGRGLGSRGH